jgi:DnaJ-class molecular chaperone
MNEMSDQNSREKLSVAWCPFCNGYGKVEKLGLFGFKLVRCKACDGTGCLRGS